MIKSFQSILCLNGRIPHEKLFDQFRGLPVIAADGAGSSLINMGLKPTLIVGDMDSFSEGDVQNVELIYHADQNFTDFEKCIWEMEKRSLFPALVCGVAGKEIDHTLNNIHCLMKYGQQYSMVFYDDEMIEKPKWCIPLYDFYKFKGIKEENISLLPYPSATLSTKGLKWDLKHEKLSTLGRSGVRNRAASSTIEITVHQGQVLMIIDRYPLLPP